MELSVLSPLVLVQARLEIFCHPDPCACSSKSSENRGKWRFAPGVYAKDVILHIIRKLGVNGGTGFAYEYAGSVFDNFSMEERMTACNMSIEGGARVVMYNPVKTFEYLKGRAYSPNEDDWEAAVQKWVSTSSDPGCDYDDVVIFDASEISPTVTWGLILVMRSP